MMHEGNIFFYFNFGRKNQFGSYCYDAKPLKIF